MQDDFDDLEIDEQIEDLEAIENWADGAVLWSTDWTTETVFRQMVRGNINLDPIFQRRSAWNIVRQSLFIESLILGLPIPQLILAEDPKKKGSFIVIDGKQRLLAIRAFAANDENDDFKPLKLRGLKELHGLNGKNFAMLRGDPVYEDEITAYENSSIRTVIIRNWTQEAYLYEVFLRINTGSVQLSPQELRQALHPGDFSKFVDSRSADSSGIQTALKLKGPDPRMRDAELLLRYLANKNFADTNDGNLKKFLDATTRTLNEAWETEEKKIQEQCDQMEQAFLFTENAFGEEDYLRKWNGDSFERRKNRAVMDIMLHYFSDPTLRKQLAGKESLLVEAFKSRCETDVEFLNSFETTTKSIAAHKSRFDAWADELTKVAGAHVQSPYQD